MCTTLWLYLYLTGSPDIKIYELTLCFPLYQSTNPVTLNPNLKLSLSNIDPLFIWSKKGFKSRKIIREVDLLYTFWNWKRQDIRKVKSLSKREMTTILLFLWQRFIVLLCDRSWIDKEESTYSLRLGVDKSSCTTLIL